MNSTTDSLSYQDAGVNIEAGDALVERIKPMVRRTHRPEVMSSLGGFNALCKIPTGYKNPVLVSGTDGVGTKLRLAMQLQQHQTIGIDLVAMCVNDLLVCGAEPLFFLDYYATGHLDVDSATAVISGIAAGCEQAGCALVGGETAEMPGMYAGDDYDLAGFCVGVVEEDQLIDGSKVRPGDKLIALGSSGVHSNGYSLVRKVLEMTRADIHMPFAGSTLGATLLTPTRIYAKTIQALLGTYSVHAMAHITGGGLPGNLPRVLPQGTCARLDSHSWTWPPVFSWLQQQGHITTDEMYKTFNCGVGMVLVVPDPDATDLVHWLNEQGETAWILGEILFSKEHNPHVVFI